MLSLGALESAIMERAWEADHPLSAPELLNQLRYERPLATQTVFTVMERLRRKGWLARKRYGRSYHYWATMTRADRAARLMDQALAECENREATLGRFVSMLNSRELDDLRKAVEKSSLSLPAAASF